MGLLELLMGSFQAEPSRNCVGTFEALLPINKK
jgi:hypothetical protein